MQPFSNGDLTNSEKFVIVLGVTGNPENLSNWQFLSKSQKTTSTNIQSHIKIFDDHDDAEFVLFRLTDVFGFTGVFILPVTLQTHVTILADWSLPANPTGVTE